MKKKVLIIVNVGKDESKLLAKEISSYLEEREYTVDLFNFDGFCKNKNFKGYDFVVTLGGDGTVLYAARNCVDNDIPIFPINLGQFGFMAPIQPKLWKEYMDAYLSGKDVYFQERSLLKSMLIRDGKVLNENLSLNDIVINAKESSATVFLFVHYDNLLLCRLKSDGVIICSPTGSTAYSASAGGPIVDPTMDAFVMTPLNSFSLSSRPIVLNAEGTLEIHLQPCRAKAVNLIVDGQTPISLQTGDIIRIVKNQKKIKLLFCDEEKFYNSLRSKLNWRGEPYA